MIETKKKITRQIATKISIQEILNGEFIQDQENKSTYLKNGAENVYRVNLICIILQKEQLGSITNFLIDDGSAKIVVRFFENNQRIEKISVGNVSPSPVCLQTPY